MAGFINNKLLKIFYFWLNHISDISVNPYMFFTVYSLRRKEFTLSNLKFNLSDVFLPLWLV